MSDDSILVRFVEWTKLKIKLHLSDKEKEVYFRKREIWWVSLGVNIGHEQEGKPNNFERPILVLRKFNKHLLWAVPLTSKIKEDNPYYYQFQLDGEESSAILSQLRVLSSKRLIRKIGMFPEEHYEKIREEIRRLV